MEENNQTSIQQSGNIDNQILDESTLNNNENPPSQNKIKYIDEQTNSRINTGLERLVYLVHIGFIIFSIILWFIQPVDGWGSVGVGVFVVFLIPIVGSSLLIVIMFLVSYLPVNLGLNTINTIYKSPRYIAYILIISLIILLGISFNFLFWVYL